jgi:hypothetical protein
MGTKIFHGRFTNSSDQIYLVDKGKIFKGKFSNSSDEIKNIQPTGINIVSRSKIYKGKFTNSSDQIMTIDKNKVFKGRFTNSSDQIAVIDGQLNDSEFENITYLIAQRNNLI